MGITGLTLGFGMVAVFNLFLYCGIAFTHHLARNKTKNENEGSESQNTDRDMCFVQRKIEVSKIVGLLNI